MPDKKVAAHRLASLREGLFMDAPTAASLIQAGVDPNEWQQAVRDKIARIAEGKRDD